MASDLTPDQMFQYFQAGALGTKEFRSWLAKYDETFSGVRDADVDNEIDRLARERAEAQRQRAGEESGLTLVDQDGTVRGM